MTDAKTYAGQTVNFEAVVRDEPVELLVPLTGDEITDKLTLQMGADNFHRAIRNMSVAEDATIKVVHVSLGDFCQGMELTGNEETDRQKLDDLACSFYQGMLAQ